MADALACQARKDHHCKSDEFSHFLIAIFTHIQFDLYRSIHLSPFTVFRNLCGCRSLLLNLGRAGHLRSIFASIYSYNLILRSCLSQSSFFAIYNHEAQRHLYLSSCFLSIYRSCGALGKEAGYHRSRRASIRTDCECCLSTSLSRHR